MTGIGHDQAHHSPGPTSDMGQNRKYSLRADDVRSTPESGLKSDIAPCPKSANKRLMHRSKLHHYSITSSERARDRWLRWDSEQGSDQEPDPGMKQNT